MMLIMLHRGEIALLEYSLVALQEYYLIALLEYSLVALLEYSHPKHGKPNTAKHLNTEKQSKLLSCHIHVFVLLYKYNR